MPQNSVSDAQKNHKEGTVQNFVLIDSNGNIVVEYVYDAWGNHAVLSANGADLTDATHIGNLNPFRYRGYFYDVETGLYYLQTRYYDPEIGRFVTIDDLSYADPEIIHGLNLYAYCGNNPVMYTDPTGTAKWWEWLLLGVAALAAVALVVVGTALSGGSLAVLGGALAGSGSGFLLGAGGSIVSQGIASNWQNIDPMNALISGGIGAAVGFITGVAGAYVGQLGEQAGMQFGYNLSQTTIAGLKVGKALEYLGGIKMIMGVGKVIGSTAGIFIGGAMSNELANNLIRIDPSVSDNFKAALDGVIQGWILDVIYQFF